MGCGWLVANVGGSLVNKWATDNLITHICALALVIDHFEVDTSQLREDLRLENKESVDPLHTSPRLIHAITSHRAHCSRIRG